MTDTDIQQVLLLLRNGAALALLCWVALFVVIFIDQFRKGRR